MQNETSRARSSNTLIGNEIRAKRSKETKGNIYCNKI